MTQRAVAFTDIYNFRDLGGYSTVDGRTVAWGRLYRSDDLCQLRQQDHEAFTALGIRTVIDLRRPGEVEQRGRFPELAGVDYQHVHLAHPLWVLQSVSNVDERVAFLLARYAEMATNAAEGIGLALRLIADPQNAPVVVHCIAGKDRTGIVAALALSLLGVDDETIGQDYALSEESERTYRERNNIERRQVVIAPAAAMTGFLALLRAEHGSIEAYVRSLGVTDAHLASMRDHLLV